MIGTESDDIESPMIYLTNMILNRHRYHCKPHHRSLPFMLGDSKEAESDVTAIERTDPLRPCDTRKGRSEIVVVKDNQWPEHALRVPPQLNLLEAVCACNDWLSGSGRHPLARSDLRRADGRRKVELFEALS